MQAFPVDPAPRFRYNMPLSAILGPCLGRRFNGRRIMNTKPRIIAWELTRRCNLKCAHCRSASTIASDTDELSTPQIISVMDAILPVARPLLILTGGEPMLRPDLFDIIAAAHDRGFTVAVAPNGTLLDEPAARKMVSLGVHRVSISLDGPTADLHDDFRGEIGAFDAVMRACQACKVAGLPFQINTTLTSRGINHLEQMVALAASLGAVALHTFSPVPVGRARELDRKEISASLSPQFLERLLHVYQNSPIPVRVTCAPQFYRLLRERTGGRVAQTRAVPVGHDSFSHGCIAGRAYVFIAANGSVQPCGYLPISCGNVLSNPFAEIWEKSETLANLRNPHSVRGKCRSCDSLAICGGCRARAYALTGDYLAPDPFCNYQSPASAISQGEGP